MFNIKGNIVKIGRQKEKYKTMKKQQHLPKRRGKILEEKK